MEHIKDSHNLIIGEGHSKVKRQGDIYITIVLGKGEWPTQCYGLWTLASDIYLSILFPLFPFLISGSFSIARITCSSAHCLAQTGLEPTAIFLLGFPKCWNYRCPFKPSSCTGWIIRPVVLYNRVQLCPLPESCSTFSHNALSCQCWGSLLPRVPLSPDSQSPRYHFYNIWCFCYSQLTVVNGRCCWGHHGNILFSGVLLCL